MNLTKQQVDYISSYILISDVLAHIEKTHTKYEEFMKQEKLKENKTKKLKETKMNTLQKCHDNQPSNLENEKTNCSKSKKKKLNIYICNVHIRH